MLLAKQGKEKRGFVGWCLAAPLVRHYPMRMVATALISHGATQMSASGLSQKTKHGKPEPIRACLPFLVYAFNPKMKKHEAFFF